ncbi:MAG: GTPase Era, partial [Bacilli bacterium]|nr:GTPase Era [Bacilli bacterium]
MKSGFVSLIGRPNVGKSTLLNTLINQKIAITSNKPQTTRNIIQGIYNDDGYQIVFVDTPGIHKPLNKLGKVLNKEAQSLTKDVDLILLLVDAQAGIGNGDKKIISSLEGTDSKVILVLNKIDKMTDIEIIKAINDYKDLYNFAEIVPISAITT